MEYTIIEYKEYSSEEILPLYAAVGWTNYTDCPEMLQRAYGRSLCTLAAYDGEELVGVIRAVGDGYSVIFIQDLLVYPDYQRCGIGTSLLSALKKRFPNVYQMELLTDNTARSRAFYEANGFAEASGLGCLAYLKMN